MCYRTVEGASVTRNFAAALVAAIAIGLPGHALLSAQPTSRLAGRWTLNRELSQFPRDVGFGADMMSGVGSGTDSSGGGRGRGRSSGGGIGGFPMRSESEDDAKRAKALTNEVRNPAGHLTIVETPMAVTITDDRGLSRTFHPDGKEEVLRLDDVPVAETTRWEAGRLVVVYKVEKERELRYTYSSTAEPPQLTIDVRFIERGGHDSVRRVYEPSSATDTVETAAATPPPAVTKPAADLARTASAADSGKAFGSGSPTLPTFAQQPGAEFKGLTKLGVVVEELSPQATACGLSQHTIETAVSKSMSDAGFKVLTNSDEDTYVYVNIMTTNLASGLCVSRYDASLETHTTAKLSYQDTPVLVEVSLLHKGGIAGGAPAAHAEAVLRGVKQYVDQFATRIRDANK
jgi:hypothetical protein